MESLDLLQALLISEQSLILVLALVAALFLFLLIVGRLNRIERKLQGWVGAAQEQLRETARVVDRLRGGAEASGAMTGRSEALAGLESLRRTVDALREELTRIGDEVGRRLESPAAPTTISAAPVVLSIRERLASEDYEKITILGDDQQPADDGAGESRVGVSAMRGGVTYKGHAIIRDGKVAEILLRPCYGAFP